MIRTRKLTLSLKLTIILFTAGTLIAGKAFALWLDPNWGYRQMITIESSQVPGDLTDFPVLVKVTGALLRVSPNGNVGKANGGDILFTAADGITKLDHEIENYNSATGELVAWVKVPAVSSTPPDTVIYIYYGNAGAADQWETDGSTWDGNYVGVWHLNETVTDESTSEVHKDSTYNDDGVQNNNATAVGQIANGQDFDGSQDWVQIDKTSITFTDFTYSAWINTNTIPPINNWDTIIDFDNDKQLLALEDSSYNIWGRCGNINHGTAAFGWHHIVWSVSVPNYTLYVDGVPVGSNPTCAASRTGRYIMIGSGLGGNEYFDGRIDEVRISNTARSADWITASYNNQNAPSSFLTFNVQEMFIPVPTMTEWGMIIFTVLAGIGSFFYLRKKKIES